jgi:hypothetical protein
MPPEADEQAPEQVQDTPINGDAAPEETAEPSKPAVDYQKRYDDLVPEYTRGQQLIAAARGDHGPEVQMQALQQLGVEVQQEEEAEEDDPFVDPGERALRETEALKAKLAEKDEQEESARFQKLEREFIDTTLGEIEGKENVKLSKRDKHFVETAALSNRLDDGRPDLEGAVKDLIELRNEARDGYIASKKAPKAPLGTAGEDKIDFSKMSKDEIDQWMAEDIEARMAEQS